MSDLRVTPQQVSLWSVGGDLGRKWLSAPRWSKHHLHISIPGGLLYKPLFVKTKKSSLIILLAFMDDEFSLKLPRRVENQKVHILPKFNGNSISLTFNGNCC